MLQGPSMPPNLPIHERHMHSGLRLLTEENDDAVVVPPAEDLGAGMTHCPAATHFSSSTPTFMTSSRITKWHSGATWPRGRS